MKIQKEKLIELRTKRKINGVTLSRGIGVDWELYRKWEDGSSEPSYYHMTQIAKCYEMNLHELAEFGLFDVSLLKNLPIEFHEMPKIIKEFISLYNLADDQEQLKVNSILEGVNYLIKKKMKI